MRALRAWVKRNPAVRTAAFVAQNAVQAVRPAVSTPAGRTPGLAARYRLTSMIRVKDEGRFLPEWLAHHIGLGVEHVYVYDNNSSDDIQSVIAPFVDRGLATYVLWPTIPASPSCHVDFLARFGRLSEWVAFLDADEFLVEGEPGDLAHVLASASGPAVAVNWRYFGSAGHSTVPPGLITEHFDRADAAFDSHVKVIAHPGEVHRYRNSHNFYYRRGRLARTTDGRRVFGSFVRRPGAAQLVVRHYVYRSREDYERKAGHGFVDASGARDRARVSDRAAREFHRHNDMDVAMPADVLRRTASLLAELGYPIGLVGSPGAKTRAGGPSAGVE